MKTKTEKKNIFFIFIRLKRQLKDVRICVPESSCVSVSSSLITAAVREIF